MYIVSEVVRAMLKKEYYGFNTFTGVRVGEIQTTEDPRDFYWIAGGKNIADLLSRGSTNDKLLEHSKWQQRTEFLQWPVQEWLLQQRLYRIEDLPELIQTTTLTNVLQLQCEVVDAKRFTSVRTMKRTLARLQAVLSRTKKSLTRIFENPTKECI